MSSQTRQEFTGTERFRLLRRVGSGGMGVVYEAFDEEWRLRVALKTLTRLDPRFLYLFKQEFRSLCGITHAHLAQLYELISDGDHWFFTMEFIDGVNFLRHVWGRDRRTAPRDSDETLTSTQPHDSEGWPGMEQEPAGGGLIVPALAAEDTAPVSPANITLLREAMRQLVEGVMALHEEGKLHRDVKPSNLMVREGGHLLLLDFGLVSEMGSAGVDTRDISGTIAYMAPEQARGKALTEAADWYAAGVTLYEALTGCVPFQGAVAAVLDAKRRMAPRPPHRVVAGVPEDLEALCLQLLHSSPAERPSGREILSLLGDRSVVGPSRQGSMRSPATASLLVGREQHLESLESAFSAARAGAAATAFVSGESGFGKSSLVEHFLDVRVRAGDCIVLRGRCYEQESVPYKAFDALIDSLSRYLGQLTNHQLSDSLPEDIGALARLFPVLHRFESALPAAGRAARPGDQLDLRRRAFAALRELLRQISRRSPLVLFIDDLQWGDIDSALLLNEILRPPADYPVLVICSYRSEYAETSRCLRHLTTDQRLDRREIRVGPLEFEQARRLALALLGGHHPAAVPQAELIARESKGSPYFVRELAGFLNPSLTGGASGDISLDSLLWSRVSGLPGASLKLLEVIAVSGRPLSLSDALEAAGVGADDPGVLGVLRAARMIRGTGLGRADQVEAYHDRIRETVVSHLVPTALRAHHRRLAEMLVRIPGTDPERLAVHYLGGGDPDTAGQYYSLAAEQAAKALAFDRAADLCQRAMDLVPAGTEAHHRLEVSLADALANAGRGPLAARQYLAAAANAPPSERQALNQQAAYHFCASGYVDEGRAAFRDVLAQVGLGLPDSRGRAIASVLTQHVRLGLRGLGFRERSESQVPAAQLARADAAWAAAIGLSMVDIVAGAGFAKRAVLEALEAGEPHRVARAVAWEAAHRAGVGPREERTAMRWLAASAGIAAQSGHLKAIAWSRLAAGVAYLQLGRWRDAVDTLDDAERLLREYGRDIAWEIATADTCLLFALNDVGHYAEMAQRAPSILETGLQRGNLYVATNIGTWVMPQVRLAADDPDGARRQATESLANWSQQGFHLQHLYALIQCASASIYTGEGQRAVEEVNAQWKAASGSLLFRAHLPRSFTIHIRARACLRAAETAAAAPEPLLRRVLADAGRMEKERAPWATAAALLLRAGAASVSGRQDTAVDLLRQTEQAFLKAEMGHYLASARRRLGTLVGGAEGRRALAASDAWMADQGIADADRFAALHAPGFAR